MAKEYKDQVTRGPLQHYELVLQAQQDVAYATNAQTLLDLMMARQTSFFMKLPSADKQYVTNLVVKLKERVDG